MDRPRADSRSPGVPLGLNMGGQNGTKIDPKTIKIEEKNQESKKQIQDDLGLVWGQSWAVWGAILDRLGPQNRAVAAVALVFLGKSFFRCSTVRRRLWDQLWPTKVPKRPKMTPKTEPKSTPRGPKIDMKIDIQNDAKTKRARHLLSRSDPQTLGRDTPPGSRPRPHGTSKKS